MTRSEISTEEAEGSRRNVAPQLQRMMEEEPFSFGDPPIVAVRQMAGFSQAEFARILGVTVGTLREWEGGAQTCNVSE